jgi:hypothetical protein
MGLFNNLMAKVSEKIEKSMSKNLTGESKEQYEKEKAERLAKREEFEKQQQLAQAELDKHKTPANKNELKNIEPLLEKIEVLDDKKLWLAGFDNFKTNQNSKAANLFSGNKNIKVLSLSGDTYYVSKFDGDNFYAYKQFSKEDVVKIEVEGMLSKKIKLNFKDGKSFSVDITENKDKAADFKNLLK